MPVLNTEQDVIAVLGTVATADNPIAELERKGYVPGDSLRTQWENAKAGAAVLRSRPIRERVAGPRGPVAFHVGKPAQVIARDLAPGDYEVLAGVETSVANEAFAGLYESGTIPHVIALDQLLSATQIAALGGAFQVDRPGGTISRLLILSPPTLTTIADNTDVVAVRIPLRLNFDRIVHIATGERRINVTFATGVLKLTMHLVTKVVSRPATGASVMTYGVELIPSANTPATSPRLDLDANSPVQRTSPAPLDQVDPLAVLIQNVLSMQFQNQLLWTVSPLIPLPIGRLEFHQLDVRTSGAVLVAGLRIAQGAGDPARLASLLPGPGSNMFVQVRDQVVNALLQQALSSGQLTASAQAVHPDAVIDSASGRFANNALVADVSGHIVDLCPLNVDFYFSATRTDAFKFLGNQVEIDESTDKSIWDAHNLWCLLTTIGAAALLYVVSAGTVGFLAALPEFGALAILSFLGTNVGNFLIDSIVSGGGGDGKTFIDLNSPIPGTDRLPTISDGVFQVQDGAMLVAARVATRMDDVNTYLYARFLVPDGLTAFATRPLVGARVVLMDQDKPAPPGDDASTRAPHSTFTDRGGVETTTSYAFQAPGSDSTVTEGRTDLNGVVRFALTPAQLVTTAGQILQTVTREDPRTGEDITRTSHIPVPEKKPDLYFRVFLPDGTSVDTRTMPGGFMINVTSLRAGSLANPVTFALGGSAGGVLVANG